MFICLNSDHCSLEVDIAMNMIRGVVLLWCGATSYAFMSSLFGSGAKEEVGARRGVVIEPPRRLLPRSATHGVSEESWALYSGSTFTCGDGKVIPSENKPTQEMGSILSNATGFRHYLEKKYKFISLENKKVAILIL